VKNILSILLLFISSLAFGQSVVTGKVISNADKKPVPYASVFLSNSVVGAQSADDGSFTLNNVKNGQYDLVISFIGFESHHQTITVNGANLDLGIIQISPKSTTLKEVKITNDPNREHNLATFEREFLGQSDNAQQCQILNPDVINISYDANGRNLTASSDDFIIIENKALGYKVHYQLNKFLKDDANRMLYYEGSVLFEAMKGRPGQEKRWQKNRMAVYLGSDMHFLRSIFANRVNEEGFRVMKLIRKPNPNRPPDSMIRAKLLLFATNKQKPGWADSADTWRKKERLPKKTEYLIKTPLTINDFVLRTDNRSMLALQYTDHLYVIYTRKKVNNTYNSVFQQPDMADYPTTVISLNKKYAVFDSNGVFIDPNSTVDEGAWGLNRVADLLPVDYVPDVIVK
jgi:hypothetical protein